MSYVEKESTSKPVPSFRIDADLHDVLKRPPLRKDEAPSLKEMFITRV